MNIDLKKLITILENKSNRAINMLDELKCTTPEFKTILDSVLNNLDAIKQVKQYDIDCPDCKSAEEPFKKNIPDKTHDHKEKNLNNERVSLVGKKWIPYKGGK
jgi:hypothetical protein